MIPLEKRLTKFVISQIGEPASKAEAELKRMFHGDMIGGGYQLTEFHYYIKSRAATFIAGDISIEVSVCD